MLQRIRLGVCLTMCATVLTALPALAGEQAINLSLVTPISIAKETDSVSAFRFNLIYGKNTSVGIVDLGLVNHTTKLSHGLQWGGVNYTEGAETGVQLGTVNINMGTTQGLQWAGFNYAEHAGGLQLAVVNYAKTLDGLQVGVINIIGKGGFLPVCIIANWSK